CHRDCRVVFRQRDLSPVCTGGPAELLADLSRDVVRALEVGAHTCGHRGPPLRLCARFRFDLVGSFTTLRNCGAAAGIPDQYREKASTVAESRRAGAGKSSEQPGKSQGWTK